MSATYCLLHGNALALEAVNKSLLIDSHTANLGVKLVETSHNFCNVLGMVQIKLPDCLEFPCRRGITECSISSKQYCTNARCRVSPS